MRGATTPEEIDAALPALLEAVRATDEREDDDAWSAVFDATRPLFLGDPELVETAMLALLSDARWQARAAAIQVLRYLTGPYDAGEDRPSIPRALERACVLVAMVEAEPDARVRAAIVSAFVDLKADVGDALTAAFASRFASDPDASMRSAVVGALSGIDRPEVIATLIALSADPDDAVRDWACFALGHQLGSPHVDGGIVDTDELREALAARLDDPHDETREEAATGLALRGDARGIERMIALLERFDDEGVTERVLMTASEAPDPRYVAPLEHIAREAPELHSAAEALAACRALRPRPTCGWPLQHVGCACMRAGIR